MYILLPEVSIMLITLIIPALFVGIPPLSEYVSNMISYYDNVPINKKLELIEGEGKYTEIEYEYTPFSEEQHGEHHHH